MSRYIDADKLLNSLPEDLPYKASVKRVLIQAPSADVVAVVRCRDCMHNRDNGGDCDRTIILNEYDSTEYRCAGLEYCSYGERSEQNEG